MTPEFQRAFAWVIEWEGSEYEDVPGDPGGPTKYGITQHEVPELDIKDLTIGQAEGIYWQNYWLNNRCDKLPTPVAETHFNFCVNTGPSRSTRFMQATLGVTQDGDLGPITLTAARAAHPMALATGMIERAGDFYRTLASRGMRKFLAGWLNRNLDLTNQLALWRDSALTSVLA
jgi:lysozyme family protein